MHRIDTEGNADGLWQDGNPQFGQQGTTMSYEWLNSVQEEIVGVILAAGIALAKGDNTQLLDAIQALDLAALNAGKAYTDGAVAAEATQRANGDAATLASARVPVGNVMWTVATAAPAGWMKADGQTIGSAASGATGRAHADTEALFTHLWNNVANTELPIQTSAGAASVRGASAAADFAANKRLPLPDLRGEFIRGLDDGRGVDVGRVLASAQADQNKAHTHTFDLNVNFVGSGTPAFEDGSGTTNNTFTTASSGGNEARPRNVALLAIIKT